MKRALTRRDFLKVSGGALAGAYALALTGVAGALAVAETALAMWRLCTLTPLRPIGMSL